MKKPRSGKKIKQPRSAYNFFQMAVIDGEYMQVKEIELKGREARFKLFPFSLFFLIHSEHLIIMFVLHRLPIARVPHETLVNCGVILQRRASRFFIKKRNKIVFATTARWSNKNGRCF